MCERPGFWRWLAQGFVGTIKAIPKITGEIIGGLCADIRKPLTEVTIGSIAGFLFFVIPALDIIDPFLTSTVRVIFALLTIPSFLIMMHGIYRMEDDC